MFETIVDKFVKRSTLVMNAYLTLKIVQKPGKPFVPVLHFVKIRNWSYKFNGRKHQTGNGAYFQILLHLIPVVGLSSYTFFRLVRALHRQVRGD